MKNYPRGSTGSKTVLRQKKEKEIQLREENQCLEKC